MNVIFLDIDGVMNSQMFYTRRYKRRWLKPITYYWLILSKVRFVFNGFKPKYYTFKLTDKRPRYKNEFKYLFNRLKEETDPVKWRWLSEFCNQTDTKICISSVWKRHFEDPSDWSKALQILGFKENSFAGITGDRRKLRGIEIKEWLNQTSVNKYAILDDDSDMLLEQLPNFFQIDPYYGISPNTIYSIGRHFELN